MIDVEYIKKALPKNKISAAIDDSWREKLHQYKTKRKIIPLQPSPFQPITIMMGVGEKCIYILIGERTISIEKMLYNKKMYCIKEPLVFNTKIWAKIATSDALESLHMNPAWGFHFLGTNNIGELDYPPICLGDMKLPSLNSLKDISLFVDDVVKMLHIVNTGSIGTVYLPPDSPLQKGINTGGMIEGMGDYISGLLDGNIITPFLKRLPINPEDKSQETKGE